MAFRRSARHDSLPDVTADQHHAEVHNRPQQTTAVRVQEEGITQGDVVTFNFVGLGVTVTVAGTTATVTVL